MFDIHFEIKTLIKLIHLFGLALGIGGALLLDIIIFNFFHKREITQEKYEILKQSSSVVAFGLLLLWLSGIGYLIYYAAYVEHELDNPKIWAKVTIVAVLTLNGMLIHRFVLPYVRERIGKTLFHSCGNFQQFLMLAASVVSITSWLIPLGLGASKELSFSVGSMDILLTYGAVVLTGIIVAQVFSRLFINRQTSLS